MNLDKKTTPPSLLNRNFFRFRNNFKSGGGAKKILSLLLLLSFFWHEIILFKEDQTNIRPLFVFITLFFHFKKFCQVCITQKMQNSKLKTQNNKLKCKIF
ncbi:hypothetical protein AMJ48_01120 [Parcubacteria bacterium DG_74_1]|nr:MAG: hypothetical protein AMJ48_01120 [Parcubacteria bacterium DG_74_1]